MDDTAVKSLNGEASTPFASTFGIHCEHDGIPSVTASKRILIWFLSPSSRRSLDLIFPTPSANYTCIKMIDGKVGVTQLIRPLALTSCSCGYVGEAVWSENFSQNTDCKSSGRFFCPVVRYVSTSSSNEHIPACASTTFGALLCTYTVMAGLLTILLRSALFNLCGL